MNPKVTLGLVLILLALGGYVYFFELEKSPEDPSVQTIYGVTYGEYDIVELEIKDRQQEIRFARTNQSQTRDWAMVAPVAVSPDELDQVLVNGTATGLGRLTASQTITGVTNLVQYGLDLPQLTVTLTLSNGQIISLYTGDETPVNNNRYLYVGEDRSTVQLVSSFAIDQLYRFTDGPPLAPTPQPTSTPSS